MLMKQYTALLDLLSRMHATLSKTEYFAKIFNSQRHRDLKWI